jgi:leucyl/phenylalanyl-tRNA--protein transferase
MRQRLTADLIIKAYAMGVFPMGDSENPNAPVRWYSPDPRCIFDFENFHVPKRLARTYRKGHFECQVNTAWREVLQLCAARDATWITDEIYDAYTQLYLRGMAHSVEVFHEGQLAGGLYGVSIGGAFMGESMFHVVTDASKIALIYLVERLKERGFTLLDCQFMTEHLRRFGAVEISQAEYLKRLEYALSQNVRFDD